MSPPRIICKRNAKGLPRPKMALIKNHTNYYLTPDTDTSALCDDSLSGVPHQLATWLRRVLMFPW